ncbi:serine/arginine repetitive matrix protein 2 [Streptomyces sp. NBC_00102]|uniref:serine/arginine repetitive matrix protein 2 n=1 Tax=Streptomyces sp. NBC_00102 TaxID=2975652 RepID=UPI00225780FE|nr:serine/arginine repetitive matrix protein 2 [Streptomyces sp. NBC_00102]MCX5399239.1 serine/arginine repetitive matrix protein 2 [Streptomyces sp. NBC_00102]
MKGGGAPRWNDETQRWETGDHPPPAVPPPLPASPPVAPAPPVAPPGAYVPPQPPEGPAGGYVHGPDGRGGFAVGTGGETGVEAGGGGLVGGFVGGFVGEVEPGDGVRVDGVREDGVREDGVGTVWQRITPLTAGLTVGVLAACTAALWFTLAKDDHHAAAQGTSASESASVEDTSGGPGAGEESPVEPIGEGPSPTDEETDPATAGPGYARVDDVEGGFTVVVPEEWQNRTEDDHGVYYTSADGTSLLQIWQVTGVGSALDAVRTASESRSASPGFQEISVEEVDSPDGGDAAELVYAYDHEATGTRRQVIDRVFTASDGKLYALLVAAPDTEWPLHEEILAEAVAGFAPRGPAH